MPKNYSLGTLTSDILREVEEGQAMQKTAAELAPEYKSELAQHVAKLAAECRSMSERANVSYEDIQCFLEKQAGLGQTIRNIPSSTRKILKKVLGKYSKKAVTETTQSGESKVKPWHVAVGIPATAGAMGGSFYLGRKSKEK